jgi:non-ribosomal peptide synthase protein (TIGR01720 family)
VLTARTPAGLARLTRALDESTEVRDAGGTGRFPAPPTMRWWLENTRSTDGFTMSTLFEVPAGLGPDRIAAALARLMERHPALRLRLGRDEKDGWTCETAPSGVAPKLERTDAAGLEDAAVRARAAAAAADVRLSPREGRIVAAHWFDAGPQRPGRLLLTIHHVAVDAVSWRILGPELAELLATGRLDAPPPADGLLRWAAELDRGARGAEAELPFWTAALTAERAQLAAGRASSGRRDTVTVTLDTEATDALVTRLPAAFRCTPEAVLLTALLAAAAQWRDHDERPRGERLHGERPHLGRLSVELEGHGRSIPSSRLDLSGAVGWFTCLYPVLLEAEVPGGGAPWPDAATAERALKQIKERLNAVPDGGLGYGLLRYRNARTAAHLAELAEPQVQFNYLGRIGGSPGAAEFLGVLDQGAMPLTHLVEVDAACVVEEGGARLVATWSYPDGTFSEDEVRALAEGWSAALEQLAGYAYAGGFGGLTASDLPLVALPQGAIEAFEAELDEMDEPDAMARIAGVDGTSGMARLDAGGAR